MKSNSLEINQIENAKWITVLVLNVNGYSEKNKKKNQNNFINVNLKQLFK